MASLRDLGLSEYEERAYRSLLKTGPTTAKELSRTSDVPMGRIYDVLNSLETKNLVRSQAASRPKKYVAVEPETALDRLLADKREELEERITQYERSPRNSNNSWRSPNPSRSRSGPPRWATRRPSTCSPSGSPPPTTRSCSSARAPPRRSI